MSIRGFEKVSTMEFKKRAQTLSMSPERLYNDVVLPTRASIGSAGYDFRVITKFTLRPGEIKILPTGIKAYMDIDEYLSIHIRSSLAIKYGIVLVNQEGIIDADYYGNDNKENSCPEFPQYQDIDQSVRQRCSVLRRAVLEMGISCAPLSG